MEVGLKALLEQRQANSNVGHKSNRESQVTGNNLSSSVITALHSTSDNASNYAQFQKTFFNPDASINFPRDAKKGKKSLFSHHSEKGLRLKSDQFAKLMQIPEVASSRVSWLLLLSNFTGLNDNGSIKTPEWIKVKPQDSADTLADTIEMNMDNIAASQFGGDLNACNADLQEKTFSLITAKNLEKLKESGFNDLSNSQKLYLINELMAKYIYIDGSARLQAEPNFNEFVRKVNFLSTVQTRD
jgi:hypothetical protein